MKLIPSIAAVLIAAASFSTFAAPLSSVKQVNSEQAANLQSLGVVSVSGISGSPHDAIHALKEKPRRTAPAITALSAWTPRGFQQLARQCGNLSLSVGFYSLATATWLIK